MKSVLALFDSMRRMGSNPHGSKIVTPDFVHLAKTDADMEAFQ